MMRSLTRCIAIDIGNTRGKAAEFSGREVLRRWVFDPGNPKEGTVWMDELPLGLWIILSTVRPLDKEWLGVLLAKGPMLLLKGDTPLPFRSAYLSPETLGPDRLALAAGAIDLFPGHDLLVIDAGTCIACDLILGGELFAGGSISPGLDMRFRAMNRFTGALPLIEQAEGHWYPGRSTRESMLAGVMDGALGEVRDRINRLRRKYPGIKVIITGGDAPHFAKNLKNSIFASPDLAFKGLRAILQHHVNTID